MWGTTNLVPFNRDPAFLLPPDLESWPPDDDVAHFVVAAVERVPIGAFQVAQRPGGKSQYHRRLMLALLIYSYADGIFSSRRIERASYRDIGVRFVATNLHPDHNTIAVFRQSNQAAVKAAFLQVLLLARESGLLRLGTVSIDGTKLDANASKIRSVRYDRAKELRARLAADIAAMTAQAEATDREEDDPQALPAELVRREALKAKLDNACARLEAEARAEAEAARPDYEAKKAAYDAKKGRRGRPPRPPSGTPRLDRQSNLTDPDSALMRRSEAMNIARPTMPRRWFAPTARTDPGDKPRGDHGRCAELRPHHPRHGGDDWPAPGGAGRYRACQRPGGHGVAGAGDRTAGGDRSHAASPAL